jgi:hypothetical protein
MRTDFMRGKRAETPAHPARTEEKSPAPNDHRLHSKRAGPTGGIGARSPRDFVNRARDGRETRLHGEEKAIADLQHGKTKSQQQLASGAISSKT